MSEKRDELVEKIKSHCELVISQRLEENEHRQGELYAVRMILEFIKNANHESPPLSPIGDQVKKIQSLIKRTLEDDNLCTCGADTGNGYQVSSCYLHEALERLETLNRESPQVVPSPMIGEKVKIKDMVGRYFYTGQIVTVVSETEETITCQSESGQTDDLWKSSEGKSWTFARSLTAGNESEIHPKTQENIDLWEERRILLAGIDKRDKRIAELEKELAKMKGQRDASQQP